MKRLCNLILSALLILPVHAQQQDMKKQLDNYFKSYRPFGQLTRTASRLQSVKVNDTLRTIEICADSHFGEQVFTPQSAETIYENVQKLIPAAYKKYELSIKTGGWDIRQLVPNRLKKDLDPTRLWGDIDYEGRPWVSNTSIPYKVTRGLQNRHLSVWASHGRYYNLKEHMWRWQRPALFGTREDLFTQTIVTPYLIPMLEKAGAIVFTPRERDWQDHEAVIDNDTKKAADGSRYREYKGLYDWYPTTQPGFAFHEGGYEERENPFEAGTARQTNTVSDPNTKSTITWYPTVPETGSYAVYVSYQTVKGSIDDAHYTVWHQGIPTEFRVNQQMGGSTWVYLGTFDFEEGNNDRNCIVLDNLSSHEGIVTADGVRIGGGMGNIAREGEISLMPRCFEGSRYYAQWAGMPYSVYSTKDGQDDYGDDINARSCMTNYLAGGSCYLPDSTGRNVPIELSLAVHTDAGYTADGKTHTGTLAVCTTYLQDSILGTGRSRLASRDLADELLTILPNDIQNTYHEWQRRELFDRNYSESRIPAMPSAIIETMSHQNFADMRFGQDPNFRFDLARSIYKTLLRYVCRMHQVPYVVTPLTPDHVYVVLTAKGEAEIHWTPVDDPLEPSAKPTGFIIYTATGRGGFDNGQYVRGKGHTSLKIAIAPGKLYSFRVAAVNEGGESLPSEVVSACYMPEAEKTILIVNGFHRLSSPTVVDDAEEQGFDLEDDIGVTYGRTAGWLGYQNCFTKSTIGKEGTTGLGYTDETLAGQFIAGNDFNYIRTHADAIANTNKYSIVSCSSEALETNEVIPLKYDMIDLILGLEKNDGHSLRPYQALSPMLRQHLQLFTQRGGALLVSGSYIGADMRHPADRQYLEEVLKCRYAGTDNDLMRSETVTGLGTTFAFHRQLNAQHYSATHPDVLQPVAPAFCAMRYGDQQSACVAYNGEDYKSMTLGFPFECIKKEYVRFALMKGILNFLLH